MVDYVIKKGENKIRGFDDRVISLYARGMSMREIQGHLHEIYGVCQIFMLVKGCQKMDNTYQELEACSATVPYPAGY